MLGGDIYGKSSNYKVDNLKKFESLFLSRADGLILLK